MAQYLSFRQVNPCSVNTEDNELFFLLFQRLILRRQILSIPGPQKPITHLEIESDRNITEDIY